VRSVSLSPSPTVRICSKVYTAETHSVKKRTKDDDNDDHDDDGDYDDRFYIALFSALDQAHRARM